MTGNSRFSFCWWLLALCMTWSISAGAAVLKGVQTGLVGMGTVTVVVNAASAFPLNPVNAAQAFVICQSDTGAVTSNPTARVTCILTNNTLTITAGIADGSLNVRWYVVEFLSGVTVQRNPAVTVLAAATPSVTVGLAPAVNTSQSFVLMAGENMNSALQTIDEQWTVTGELLSGGVACGATCNQIKLTRNASVNAVSVAWQVVQIDTAAVQSGASSIPFGSKTITAVLNPAVDPERTFLVFSRRAGSGMGGDETKHQTIGQLTSAVSVACVKGGPACNQITFTRAQTGTTVANGQVDIIWYAVRMTDGTTVQANICTTAAAAGNTMPAACQLIPNAITISRSAAFVSARNGDPADVASPTADLDDTSWWSALAAGSITLTRSAGGSNSTFATVAWQVVQFANTPTLIDRFEIFP